MIDQIQALFCLEVGFIIKLLIRQICCHLMADIRQQIIDVCQLFFQPSHLLIILCHCRKLPKRASDPFRCVAILRPHGSICHIHGIHKFFPIGEFAIQLFQFLVFSYPKGGLLDFVYFILEKGQFSASLLAVHTGIRPFLFQLPILMIAAGKPLNSIPQSIFGIGIKNFQMLFLMEQGLMFMLSVNVYEKCRHLLEPGCGHSLTVNSCNCSSGSYFTI